MDIQMFFNTLDRLFSEKRPQEAEAFMRERLSQAEKESDAGAVVTICNELGGYYRAVSRYEEGVPLYQRALQIIADLHQEGTPAPVSYTHLDVYKRQVYSNSLTLVSRIMHLICICGGIAALAVLFARPGKPGAKRQRRYSIGIIIP